MSRLRLLLLATLAALVFQLPLGTSVALAASATEAQNPELIVSLTVPDQATIGETVAVTMSISNNSPMIQTILVNGIWTDPAGESAVQSRSGLLFPGQTVTRVVEYVVNETCIPGLHEVTISVESRGGTSSATAIIEVI